MLRFLPKILLVATAFAPVLLTFAFVEFWKAAEGKGNWFNGCILIVGVVFLTAACFWVLGKAKRDLPLHNVSIKSIKPADKELVGFVLAYLLPLARGTEFQGVPLMVALLIFFLVVMTSNAYHTNPLLGLLGWHFYEVVIEEVSYVLVSPRNIHNVRSIKSVVSLTDYMLLDGTK